jgi:hypothetical protein
MLAPNLILIFVAPQIAYYHRRRTVLWSASAIIATMAPRLPTKLSRKA